MKLLLHACCAPCALHPLEAAPADGYDTVTGFWYNPNIHPRGEHDKRQAVAADLFCRRGLGYVEIPYAPEDYFGVLKDQEPPARCEACWRLRIERTAEHAARGGFDAFTTTLLASPYQDAETLRHLARAAAGRYGTAWYERDFRDGFRAAHAAARAAGMYCQNYCGCVFSLIEREHRRRRRRRT